MGSVVFSSACLNEPAKHELGSKAGQPHYYQPPRTVKLTGTGGGFAHGFSADVCLASSKTLLTEALPHNGQPAYE